MDGGNKHIFIDNIYTPFAIKDFPCTNLVDEKERFFSITFYNTEHYKTVVKVIWLRRYLGVLFLKRLFWDLVAVGYIRYKMRMVNMPKYSLPSIISTLQETRDTVIEQVLFFFVNQQNNLQIRFLPFQSNYTPW
ncbi:hypothetical protein ACJX0J_028153, partial [Zea mays]